MTKPIGVASFCWLLMLSSCHAWTSPLSKTTPAMATSASSTPTNRQQFFQQALLWGAAAAAAIVAPSTASAEPFDPQTFAHTYSDPKHPNCKRIVQVSKYGNDFGEAKLAGTDGNPGCPEDGSGNLWRLNGDIVGDKITVDFSPKGGPASLKGVWDPTSPPGIRWPDGNKWTVKS
mmetsp:Transcript_24116/g.55336  ORF Transcript_24116/g.55336 Transcript_24116/m.55336 type:complete len:175 (-) Transcript_24116:3215-3739(-)